MCWLGQLRRSARRSLNISIGYATCPLDSTATRLRASPHTPLSLPRSACAARSTNGASSLVRPKSPPAHLPAATLSVKAVKLAAEAFPRSLVLLISSPSPQASRGLPLFPLTSWLADYPLFLIVAPAAPLRWPAHPPIRPTTLHRLNSTVPLRAAPSSAAPRPSPPLSSFQTTVLASRVYSAGQLPQSQGERASKARGDTRAPSLSSGANLQFQSRSKSALLSRKPHDRTLATQASSSQFLNTHQRPCHCARNASAHYLSTS